MVYLFCFCEIVFFNVVAMSAQLHYRIDPKFSDR